MSTITTGKVRFSFVNVFTPRAAQEGDEPKYSLTILIPKSDIATIQAIQQAMEATIQEGISTTFGGSRPPVLNMPLYDGDGVRPSSGEPFGEECRGHMVMTASSMQQPSVVDINVQPVLNPAELYSGCYGRVSLRFFTYNKKGKKGVGCGLGNVQKLADGEPLTSRTSATDDFGGNNAYNPNQPQFRPQSYQVPAQPQYQQQQPQYQDPAWFTQQTPNPAAGYATAPVQQPQAGYGAPQAPAQPQYQQPQYQAPQYQQAYQQPQQQINPVTGLPMTGGVMGI